jgi:hypothetical protein
MICHANLFRKFLLSVKNDYLLKKTFKLINGIYYSNVNQNKPYLVTRKTNLLFSTVVENKYNEYDGNNVQTIHSTSSIKNKNSIYNLNLTYKNIDHSLSSFATRNDGKLYEQKMYEKFIDIFGRINVKREGEISKMLHLFNPQVLKSQMRGIDFIVKARYNDSFVLLVIQVKVGARKRNSLDVAHFIRSVNLLRQFVSSEKSHSFYKLQIVPIWISSACLDEFAEEILKNNDIQFFINSFWSIDIDNCNLFSNFINKLLVK